MFTMLRRKVKEVFLEKYKEFDFWDEWYCGELSWNKKPLPEKRLFYSAQ